MVKASTMPGLTGAELAIIILAVRPKIPINMCTGFSDQMDENRAKEIGIREFIFKPVLRADICKLVRKILDERSSKES